MKNHKSSPVLVIGGGAWGTAIACQLALSSQSGQNGVRPVHLWVYEKETKEAINNSHVNPFLPDVKLPENIIAETDMEFFTRQDYGFVFWAVPVSYFFGMASSFLTTCPLLRILFRLPPKV